MDKSIKPTISITDPAFSKATAAGCVLAVDLSWDHVALGVYDPDRALWVAFEAWPSGKIYLPGHFLEKLMQVKEASVLLNYNYSKTIMLWGGRMFALVPHALFQESAREEYLKFSQNLQPGELILQDTLKNIDALNVYTIPLVVKEGVGQLFPNAILHHALSTLTESLLIRFKNTQPAQHLILNVGDQAFDMVVLKENKLVFCNSFEYKSAEDFIYYVLFVMEQLQIVPQQSSVQVCGQLLKPSAIDDLLNKYIGKVSFLSRNPQWKYSYVFDELPGHMYYNLLNVMSCE